MSAARLRAAALKYGRLAAAYGAAWGDWRKAFQDELNAKEQPSFKASVQPVMDAMIDAERALRAAARAAYDGAERVHDRPAGKTRRSGRARAKMAP